MLHTPASAVLVVAAALVATAFLLIFGRLFFRYVLGPIRRAFAVIGRRVLAPIYRVTLRPLVRAIRRIFKLAAKPAKHGAPSGAGAAPYKALVNLLEDNSLAMKALGEVPESVKSLIDSRGLLFGKTNANRVIAGFHETLTIEDAKANIELARRYYEKSVDEQLVSPTFLYEDVEEATIIEILRDADMSFFYVLRLIRRNVARNVLKSLALMMIIVALFPFALNSFVVRADFLHTMTTVNIAIYAAICLAALGFAFIVRQYHGMAATYNGLQLNQFVGTYFRWLQNQYKSAATAFSNILSDRTTRLDTVEANASTWFINLHWISARQYFLDLYVRNIMFQIRRDWLWVQLGIPLLLFVIVVPLSWVVLESYSPSLQATLSQHLGTDVSSAAFTASWSAWTLWPSMALFVIGMAFSLKGGLDRLWDEVAVHSWPSFHAMDIKDAIERNIGPIVREVVDKRRNPYGTSMPPPGQGGS
ncbi:MAG: hypothetical protein KGJ78_02855 [Alphaproteobacteria bacterium]|nr:hypothetical protein [Alphaproteobacteria bacterium]